MAGLGALRNVADVYLRLRVHSDEVKNDIEHGVSRVNVSRAGKTMGKDLGEATGSEAFKGIRRWFTSGNTVGPSWSTLGRTAAQQLGVSVGEGLAAEAPQAAEGASAMGSSIIPALIVPALAAAPVAGSAIAGALIGALGTGLAGIGIYAASKTKPVKDAFAKLKDTANHSLSQIGAPMVGVVTNILNTANGLVTALTPTFTAAEQVIAGPLKTFATTFLNTFKDPAVKKSIQDVAKAFGDILSALAPQLPGIMDGIAGAISQIAQTISKNPQTFADFVTFLGNIAKWSLQAIAGLSTAANWIQQHWSTIGPLLAAPFIFGKDVIGANLDGIIGLVKFWAGVLTGNWGAAWRGLLDGLKGWGRNMINAARAIFDAIVPRSLRHEIAVIFDGIRHDVAHWSDLTLRDIRRIWNDIYGSTIGVAIRIGHNVENVFNRTRHGIAVIWDGARHETAHVWDIIYNNTVGAAIRLGNRVRGALGGMLGWIVHSLGPALGNFFTRTLPGWFGAAARFVVSKFANPFRNAMASAWNWVKQHVLSPLGNFFVNTVPHWFQIAVSKIGQFWGKVGGAALAPVRWVAHNVLARLANAFDWVTSGLKLGKPLDGVAKRLAAFRQGGKVNVGTTETADDVLVRVSRGETIVSAAHSKVLAPYFAAAGVPGYAGGGIPVIGDILGAIGHAALSTINGIIPGAGTILKAAGSILSSDVAQKVLGKVLGLGTDGATGLVKDILVKTGKTLLSDMMSWLGGKGLGGGGAGPAANVSAGSFFSNLVTIARYFVSIGYSKAAAAGIAGNVFRESGGNPESRGSGGNGLIGWTPPKAGIVTGNPSRDLSVQLPLIQAYNRIWSGYIPQLNRITSPVLAALFYMNMFERPRGSSQSNPFSYGVSTAAGNVRAAMAAKVFQAFDRGGVLPPGLTLAYNGTGRDEYVVNPQLGIGSSGRYEFSGGSSPDWAAALMDRVDRQNALLAKLLAATEQAPARTAAGTARAINAVRGQEAQAARLGAR